VSDDLSASREHIERSQRYRLHLGMRYRGGDRKWQDGQTYDVSATGVLFDIASVESQSLRMNAPIEMTLMLPSIVAGLAVSRVVCTGRVVRLVALDSSGRVQVAATIDRHRLERVDRTQE
jgi:hypothetical protein